METLHDVVYFAPAGHSAGVGRGLRAFWMTYVGLRRLAKPAVDEVVSILSTLGGAVTHRGYCPTAARLEVAAAKALAR